MSGDFVFCLQILWGLNWVNMKLFKLISDKPEFSIPKKNYLKNIISGLFLQVLKRKAPPPSPVTMWLSPPCSTVSGPDATTVRWG